MAQKYVSSNPRWGQLATGKLSVRPGVKGTFFSNPGWIKRVGL